MRLVVDSAVSPISLRTHKRSVAWESRPTPLFFFGVRFPLPFRNTPSILRPEAAL